LNGFRRCSACSMSDLPASASATSPTKNSALEDALQRARQVRHAQVVFSLSNSQQTRRINEWCAAGNSFV
jgi:hypothetical protein